jgi:hypothetical protein
LKEVLKAMKNISIRHVVLIELLVIVATLVWRVNEVRYNVGVYDTLINTNFAGTIFLILASSVLFSYTVLKRSSRGALLLFFTLYLLLGFLSPYIANFPYYFHRDVYLHLPYSLAIAERGHIPLYADRWDISSFPGAFVFYSILMEIMGLSSISIISVLTAIIYVIMLVSIVMFFISISLKTWRMNEGLALMIMVQLLPFITRYAPRPEFPFRFHLAFLQSLLYLALFTVLMKNGTKYIGSAVCLALVYTSIVFTHPFFSLYILLASLFYVVGLLVLTPFKMVYEKARSITVVSLIITTITIIFLIHISYVVANPLLRQTYSLVFNSEQLPKFFESSSPVTITSTSIMVQIFATAVRILWRVTVIIAVFYMAVLVLLTLIRGRAPVLGVSLGVAAAIVSIPLVVSFLWWERSLVFVGIALVIAEYESFHLLLGKGLSKRLSTVLSKILPVIVLLSIVTSSLITWEGPRFVNEWHGEENILFLDTVAHSVTSPYIYIGVFSNIEFTYHQIAGNVTASSRSIFDPLHNAFYVNPCNAFYPYALSQKDPDYRSLSVNELAGCRSVIWNSGDSYIFW